MSEESWGPDDLAGDLEYLIENQSYYLVKRVVRISPTKLAMQLFSGERYIVTIEQTGGSPEGPGEPPSG